MSTRTIMALLAVATFATASAGDAYLESTGAEVIATGYMANGKSRIECDFEVVSTGNSPKEYQQRPFGQDNCGFWSGLYIDGGGTFVFEFGDSRNTRSTSVSVDNRRHTAILDFPNRRLQFITGATTNLNHTLSSTYANKASKSVGIFCRNRPDGFDCKTIMRLYSMRQYEDGELKHEFLPYKKGSYLGLYDTVTGETKTDYYGKYSTFKIGGAGVDGAGPAFVVAPSDAMLNVGEKKTLKAYAPGAISYRWTKNGQAISGGEDGELEVSCEELGAPDAYAVIAKFDLDGKSVESAPHAFRVYKGANAYLESTGAEVIATGYMANGKSRIECDFEVVSTGNSPKEYQQRPFGQDNCGFWSGLYIDGGGTFVFEFGDSRNTRGTSVSVDSKRHTAILDFPNRRLQFITGAKTNLNHALSSTYANKASKSVGIFCRNRPDGFDCKTIMRLYSMRQYEDGELKHEFLPYKKGSYLGLYDTVTGEKKTDFYGKYSTFKIGGAGVDGAGPAFVVAPSDAMLKYGEKTALKAYAPGAISYRWTQNGRAISGGEDGELGVSYEDLEPGVVNKYAVVAVFDQNGTTVESEPWTAKIKGRWGMAIILH